MSETNSIVAIYGTDVESESAVMELHKSGFDMRKVSVVAKCSDNGTELVGSCNTDDCLGDSGIGGTFPAGWGFLVDAAFLEAPGIGAVMIGGPLAIGVAAMREEAHPIGNLTVIGNALLNVGIPKGTILRYESALRENKCLLSVHGPSEEVMKARHILRMTRPEEVSVHFAAEQQPSPA